MITVTLVLASTPMETVAEAPPEEVSATAITMLIMPVMSFLSLTLKDRANRWLNIIVSIVFIVLIPFGTGFQLIPTAYLPSVILTAIAEIAALALIIWTAWKSKQKA